MRDTGRYGSKICVVIALMVIVAAMVFVPRAQRASASTTDGVWNVIQLGDSYSAGTGARDYYGAKKCYRSNNSWAKHYVAKLDELYTIEVPKKPDERAQFLERHRRFRLDPSFARDLHVRVFRAFASLGFDDVAWWSDGDLELVVNQCDAWVRKIESEIETLRQGADPRRDVLAASGEPGKAIHRLDEEIKSAEKRKREILAQYERERRELERRRSARG